MAAPFAVRLPPPLGVVPLPSSARASPTAALSHVLSTVLGAPWVLQHARLLVASAVVAAASKAWPSGGAAGEGLHHRPAPAGKRARFRRPKKRRRRLIEGSEEATDPAPASGGEGEGGDDLESEGSLSLAATAGEGGETCVGACGLCRASCCCDRDCRTLGDCCGDFERDGVCTTQKELGPSGTSEENEAIGGEGDGGDGDGGPTEDVPPRPPETETQTPTPVVWLIWPPQPVPRSAPIAPPPPRPPTENPPPRSPRAPASFTTPRSPSPPSSPFQPIGKHPPLLPPYPHNPFFPGWPVAGSAQSPPPTSPPPPPPPPPPPDGGGSGAESGGDEGKGEVAVVVGQGFSDPRGVWHSDVLPPLPFTPLLPPAPFPPFPGVPPFPLLMYSKLQAVPRCSPFCDTRAPPPSLPKGDRLWELRVAEAAKKQWAQMRDLAQIQIGGSVDPHSPWVYKGPFSELAEEEMEVLELGARHWGVPVHSHSETGRDVEPGGRELKRRSGKRRRNASK